MSRIDIADSNIVQRSRVKDSNSISERMIFGRQEKNPITIRDYLTIFFKHRITILITFVSILFLSFAAGFFFYIPRYEARSLLLVKYGWENFTPDLTSSSDKTRILTVNTGEIVQSEVQILRSRDQIERVVNYLKPETIYPSLAQRPEGGLSNAEAAIIFMERDLAVTTAKGNIIEVSMRGRYGEGITAAVNQLVNFYIEKRSDIFKDPRSAIFLQQKVDEFSQKTANAEQALKVFRDKSQIISFDDQRKLLLAQQAHLVQEFQSTESRIRETTERIAEYEKQLTIVPEKISDATGSGLALRITGTEAKLLDLQLQEQTLLTRYKEDNRLIQGVREQIRLTKDYLEKQSTLKPAEVINPIWRGIQTVSLSSQAELKALKIKENKIRQQMTELEGNMAVFEGLEQKHSALMNEVTSNQDKLNSYRQRLEEARIQDELQRQKMTSVSVLERAAIPLAPVNPLRITILIPAVLAAAFIGSLALAYLLEMLSHGVGTQTQAEKRLGLPVLVTISQK